MRIVCRCAVGAEPPEHDFGFLDDESMRLRRLEAWRSTDDAIDVDHCCAHAADQVMVIVTGSAFVQRRRTCGFDPPEKSGTDAGTKNVVHRLRGHRADAGSHHCCYLICIRMRLGCNRSQNRHSWRRDSQTHRAQLRGGFESCVVQWHAFEYAPFLELVKKRQAN